MGGRRIGWAVAAALASALAGTAVRADEVPIPNDCPDTFWGKWYPYWSWRPGGDFGLRVLGEVELRDGEFISEIQGRFKYRVLPTPEKVKRRGFEYVPEPEDAPPPQVLFIELDRPMAKGYFDNHPSRHLALVTMYDHPSRTHVYRCLVEVNFCDSLDDGTKVITQNGGYCGSINYIPRNQAGPVIRRKPKK